MKNRKKYKIVNGMRVYNDIKAYENEKERLLNRYSVDRVLWITLDAKLFQSIPSSVFKYEK